MRCVAGKEIVAVKVNQNENDESQNPIDPGHHLANGLAKPGDKSQLI